MKQFRFRKTQHLRQVREFARVFAGKCVARNRLLIVYAFPNSLGVARLGLSVSRKHGSAVKRNRIKRLLREAFRLQQHRLPPGIDLVIVPQQGKLLTLRNAQDSLMHAVDIVARRLADSLGKNP